MIGDVETIKTQLKEYFAAHEPAPDQQTRVCLFLQLVQTANASILSKIEIQPMEWLPYKLLHNQYYKNVEFLTLLSKATQWSMNPMVYGEATQFNFKFWDKTQINKHLIGFLTIDQRFYEYLALSHAFMSVIRFVPLFPPKYDPNKPFLSALNDIEEENGRQIQVQTRLLKDMEISLTHEQKQRIVEKQRQIVVALFHEVLTALHRYCQG